jgi:dihydroxycyclohexadiene carboxylate dehydrogenase
VTRRIYRERFGGQVVVVTGAAQGIGLAVATRARDEGAAVVGIDRSALVATAIGGGDTHGIVADLEHYEGAEAAIREAHERHGRIDVLVNNVGGTIWAKPYEHYTPEQIQAEVQRSLFPTLWTCRAVLPFLIDRGAGTIVNVSSVATRGINRVPYAAAKGGVNAITASLAMEVAQYGIRVVATAPGGTEAPPRSIARGPAPETPQQRGWYQQIVDQTVESSLMKRYGTLDEQAAAILFLASPEASYLTGVVIPVSGGDLG